MLWGLLALVFVVAFGGVFFLVYYLFNEPRLAERLRPLPFAHALTRGLALAMEAGWRLHQGLGAGGLWGEEGAATFAGLNTLQGTVRMALRGDQPPQISAGNGLAYMLSHNVLRRQVREHRGAVAAQVPDIPGLLDWSYAAGLLALGEPTPEMGLYLGHFGPEAGLLTETGRQVLAASEDLSTQAVLYATADHTLLGEEVFATSAYLRVGLSHLALLFTQDVFRILVLLALFLAPLYLVFGR